MQEQLTGQCANQRLVFTITNQSQEGRIAIHTRQHLNCNLFLIDNDDLLTISVIRAEAFVKTDPKSCLRFSVSLSSKKQVSCPLSFIN